MASLRDIRRRIKAVDSTKQITRAMYMISAAKLRKSEDMVNAARPFTNKLQEVLERLAETDLTMSHELLEKREVKKSLVVVITGDRGLCGSFNNNVMKYAQNLVDESDVPVELVTIGKKGRDFFKKRGYQIREEVLGVGEDVDVSMSRNLTQSLMKAYMNKEVDRVVVVYTQFLSAMSQSPNSFQLLPIEGMEKKVQEETEVDVEEYIFEPSAEDIFKHLLPKFVEMEFYHLLLETKTSEHGARMTAMKSATDNAEDMIHSLTLKYNRARQAAITTEISEIVGGAEALKG